MSIYFEVSVTGPSLIDRLFENEEELWYALDELRGGDHSDALIAATDYSSTSSQIEEIAEMFESWAKTLREVLELRNGSNDETT